MDANTITAFDGLVIVILGISAFIGLTRGFSKEILTLVAWAGAVLLTLYGLGWGMSDVARGLVSPDWLADLIAAIVLFFGGLIIFKLLAGFIGDKVKSSHIGALDRSLGTLFGLLRGILIVAAGYLLLSFFVAEDRQPDWIQNAKTRPLVAYSADILAAIAPRFAERAEEEAETRELLDIMKQNMPQGTDLDRESSSLILEEARQRVGQTIEDVLNSNTQTQDSEEDSN